MEKNSARTRPMRSASTPNSTPPNAEASKVAEAMAPACAALSRNSSRMAVSAKAYSITSMASSIQPSSAAASVFHCALVMDSGQSMQLLLLGAQQGQRRIYGYFFEANAFARAQLSHGVEIRRDHIGDLGITAGGLML